MPTRFRVALQGFSEFERSTLAFCFRHAATRDPGYRHVESLAESDFIVADASHAPLADSVTRHERLPDTLFIGDHAPRGARAQLRRPIDPERILRALDGLAALRRPMATSTSRAEPPDVLLPLDLAGTRFPTLDLSDVVDTTPAAFLHEPVTVSFTDLAEFDAATAPVEPARTAPVVAPAPAQAPAPWPSPAPGVQQTRDSAPPAAGPAPVTSAPLPPRVSAGTLAPALNEAERVAAKAAARRASRLARLAQVEGAATASPREVLLLDPTPSGGLLEALLGAFGFQVRRVDTLAAAMSALARAPVAAAFVDMDAQDGNGLDSLDFCQRVKQRQVSLAGPAPAPAPAVMLLSDRDSASARVRGQLAGADAFLVRPVGRGDAARALEDCRIGLPADARRG